MALTLNVHLLSGRSFRLTTPSASTVKDLRTQVQQEHGILVSYFVYNGHALKAFDILEAIGLEDEQQLLAVMRSARLVASRNCGMFALIRSDCTVRLWSERDSNPSAEIQNQLVDVQDIAISKAAMAVVFLDGTVLTWGDPGSGGCSAQVQKDLYDIQEVVGTVHAFAARRKDGRVFCWGLSTYGGDSSKVHLQLTDVQQVFATKYSFCALKTDGTVLTWGEPQCGGDSRAVRGQLHDIRSISSTARAFAGLRHDGSVVTWGHPVAGGATRCNGGGRGW